MRTRARWHKPLLAALLSLAFTLPNPAAMPARAASPFMINARAQSMPLSTTSLAVPPDPGYPARTAVCRATRRVAGLCPDSVWLYRGAIHSSRGYAYRNCTDFAAWRANRRAGRTVVPPGWGNANRWDTSARRAGRLVNSHPTVGSIAQSDRGAYGHVAIVVEVGRGTRAGWVRLEDYNRSARTNRGTLAYDGVYHLTSWVLDPTLEYIHPEIRTR